MGSKALGFTVEQENLIWDFHRRGESIREIERILGATMPRIRRFLRESGGIRPVPRGHCHVKQSSADCGRSVLGNLLPVCDSCGWWDLRRRRID